MKSRNFLLGIAIGILLLICAPPLVPQASLGSAVPGVAALPAACGSTSFPNTVLLTTGTTGIYACVAGSWVFIGPGGGGGSAFGSICNVSIVTTSGQSTIPSGCTLGSSLKQVFLGGKLLLPGSGNDYTVSGNNIIMDAANYSGGLPAGQLIQVVE